MESQQFTVHTVTLCNGIYCMFNHKGECIGECYPATVEATKEVEENPEGWYLVTALWFPEGHGSLFWAVDYEFNSQLIKEEE